MAHTRDRHLVAFFSKLMAFSPIVGIFGHRQVGKSTFAAEVAGTYLTFDDRKTRDSAMADPKAFVEQKRPVPIVIDECQVVPDLFPALKERVRKNKRPGQIVLTGSVRFTSRKEIRESLAGRLANTELLPLVLSELEARPLPDVVPQLLERLFFDESSLQVLRSGLKVRESQKSFERYLAAGGLPGLCFVREERLRQEALSNLHQLILDRDLRLIVGTKLSLETLGRYLRLIASKGWNPYNASEVRRELGLAPQTQKALLYALESIFLIRRIPLTGGRSGEVLLMEDQFEEIFLSEGQHHLVDQVLSAFFRNVRAQFQYRLGSVIRFESYWTRSGARVPLVVRGDSAAIGFVAVAGDKPTLSQQRSADSFLRHEPTGKIVFVSPRLVEARVVDRRVLFCGAVNLL